MRIDLMCGLMKQGARGGERREKGGGGGNQLLQIHMQNPWDGRMGLLFAFVPIVSSFCLLRN